MKIFGDNKEILKMASGAVNFVKIGLSLYLLSECKENFEEKYAKTLTVAVVNTIFSEVPANDIGENFLKNEANKDNIRIVIENSIKPEEKLKQIITDAIRVKCTVIHALNPKLSDEDFEQQCKYPIDQLKKYQLLQKGGEYPDINDFIINATSFMNACKKDYELHKTNKNL